MKRLMPSLVAYAVAIPIAVVVALSLVMYAVGERGRR